jgi:hypothetical protein
MVMSEMQDGVSQNQSIHFTLIAPATLKRKTLDPGFRRNDEQSITQHPTSLPRLS